MAVYLSKLKLYQAKTLQGLGFAIDYQEFDMGHEIAPIVLNEMHEFARKILV